MGIKDAIRGDFRNKQDKERNFSRIRTLFDLSEKNEYTIDDQTWDDITMDEVFSEIDRTYSTAGEAALYTILRNPIMDEERLKRRGRTLELFRENLDVTTELRLILFNMGFDKKNRLIDMISGELPVNKLKYYLYGIFGKLVPTSLIILAFVLQNPKLVIGLMFSVFIAIYINGKEREIIKATGLSYLRDLIKASKKISKINNEEISFYTDRISKILEEISSIDKGTRMISFINGLGGVMELVSIPFLLEETTYYKISGKLNDNDSKLFELYYLVGELDALVAIASYQKSNENKWTTPNFIEDKKIIIRDGIHPLLNNPVANSITIEKKGIVLTGTNMSGKSTFLRMISTNIILAQTLYFVFAKKYEGCFFNVVSSISPKDDINKGKSYYLAEAESILRIIKSLNKDITVFCPIDEIFRGTNPIERISSSAEILSYINGMDAICVVATHDRELTDMLKEEYNFYYFSEKVEDNRGLSFDYKIKEGVSKTRNAIKLLEYVGYPKDITKNAYKRAEKMEDYM